MRANDTYALSRVDEIRYLYLVLDSDLPRGIFGRDVCGITLPKEQRTEELAHGSILPVLAENISRVGISLNMEEPGDDCGDSLSGPVVRESIMSLMETRVRHGGSINYRFIVSKHHCCPFNRDSQVPQGSAQINDLLCAGPCCNILTTESRGFHGGL